MSLLSTYKIPQPRGYSDTSYYVEDRSQTSPQYFDVEYFPTVVGGGRHMIKLKGSGENMRLNSTIDVEIIDAEGQRIFAEVIDYIDRFNNYYISFDVYDITAQGLATVYLVGEAVIDLQGNPIPREYRDEYNVRWARQIAILPFERNNSDLVFDEPPLISAAQIVTPARLSTSQLSGSSISYTTVTSSINQLNIIQSNFQGYDRDFASSPNILDPYLKSIKVDPTNAPLTVNSVPTVARKTEDDIQNGFSITNASRFGTLLVASSSFFTKDMLGGYFEFFNSESTPRYLQPSLTSHLQVSGTVADQLQTYNATIVEVVNSKQAIITTAPSVVVYNTKSLSSNNTEIFTYKSASLFTGSVSYVPSVNSFATSSTVSQSYVEFTFSDLNPISGQVYRIKTSAKLGSIVGDYKLLNDQIVSPVEYLTDAEFSNGLNYARHDSEYLLVGHFSTGSILTNYWGVYQETPNGFDAITGSINTSVLINSVKCNAAYTQSYIIATAYNQNYNANQTYTLSFNLTLDPYTELEVYMNSDPLNTYLITPVAYTRAFNKSQNMERTRYAGDTNRFGKYLGKVVNDRATTKYYGRLLFDFTTDASGFGRPLLRTRMIDEVNQTGSAYISEVSVKPYTLNGFTPNIVQYAVPLPQELLNAATLSQSIDFKIDYFDYTGRQSEYTTYLDDLVLNLKSTIVGNTCQDDKIYYSYDFVESIY